MHARTDSIETPRPNAEIFPQVVQLSTPISNALLAHRDTTLGQTMAVACNACLRAMTARAETTLARVARACYLFEFECFDLETEI